MKKYSLFLDFDSTITNSLPSFIKTYNQRHNANIDWTKVQKYNFSDQIPNMSSKEKHDIFDSKEFFDNLDFINDNTYEVIKEISECFDICIATIGTPINLSRKAIWLNEKLPFIKKYILLNNGDCIMDKSIINCPSDSIFIDDCHSNLLSVNSKHKIIFGDEYEWSQNMNGLIRCYNWTEVRNCLI